MRYFPIFIDTKDKTIVVSGAGECALAKLRLLLKTQAHIKVIGHNPDNQILMWKQEGRIEYENRLVTLCDLNGALLLYAANDDDSLDRNAANLAAQIGVKTLIVDNLDASDFITPAIVDRDPVTVAIGTEGTAPVLARGIKADIEDMLPQSLGVLAHIGKTFRPMVKALPFGRARRDFWSRFYFDHGPKALRISKRAVEQTLYELLNTVQNNVSKRGHVDFVNIGTTDIDLLTLRARKQIHEAEVVIYDDTVPLGFLELARREAHLFSVNAEAYRKPSKKLPLSSPDAHKLLSEYGHTHRVVRLKFGTTHISNLLDKDIALLSSQGISYSIIPGVSALADQGFEDNLLVPETVSPICMTKAGMPSSTPMMTF